MSSAEHRYALKNLPPGTSVFLDGFISGLDLMHYGAPTPDLMLDTANQAPNGLVSDARDLHKETARIFLTFSFIANDILYPLIRRVYGGTYFSALPSSFEIRDLSELLSFLWRISTARDIIIADLGDTFNEFSPSLEDLSLYGVMHKEPGPNAAKADMGPGADDADPFSELDDFEDDDEEDDEEDEEEDGDGFVTYDFGRDDDDDEDAPQYLGLYYTIDSAAARFCNLFSKTSAGSNFLIDAVDKKSRIFDYLDSYDQWTADKLGPHSFFLGKLMTLFALLERAIALTLKGIGGINYLRDVSDQYRYATRNRDKHKYLSHLIDAHEASVDVEHLLHLAGKHLGSAVFLATDIFLNDPIYRGAYINKKYSESGTPLKHRHAYDRFSATHESERRRFAKMALRRSIDIINQGKAL